MANNILRTIVVDPDPHRFWIRILVGKKIHIKKKVQKCIVLKCCMLSFRLKASPVAWTYFMEAQLYKYCNFEKRMKMFFSYQSLGSGSTLKLRVSSSFQGPDPQVLSRIRILLSSSKNKKKNLDSYCFVTSFGIFNFEK